jgi:hypothetical protein
MLYLRPNKKTWSMLKDILSISGHSGLFKMVSSTKNGIIVENIEDKKRMPAYSTSKISALEDIAIFTQEGDDMPLGEVFKGIRTKENGGPAIDHKADNKALRTYFEAVMPTFDRERVYTSDIKKVIQWYNQLQKCNMLDLLDKEDEKAESKAEKAE